MGWLDSRGVSRGPGGTMDNTPNYRPGDSRGAIGELGNERGCVPVSPRAVCCQMVHPWDLYVIPIL